MGTCVGMGVRTGRRKLTCQKEYPNKFLKVTPIRKPVKILEHKFAFNNKQLSQINSKKDSSL
jgi:hypothetical protein